MNQILEMLGISGGMGAFLLLLYVLFKKYIKNSKCRTKDDGTIEVNVNQSPKQPIDIEKEFRTIKEDIEKIKSFMNTTNPDGLEIV